MTSTNIYNIVFRIGALMLLITSFFIQIGWATHNESLINFEINTFKYWSTSDKRLEHLIVLFVFAVCHIMVALLIFAKTTYRIKLLIA